MSNKIKRTNWVSTFKLIGRTKINDNSFKIDEVSESGWCYNNLNLGVDCGENYGITYVNLMGGFSKEKDNYIYVHGKNEDGSDDFTNTFQVDWEQREDEECPSGRPCCVCEERGGPGGIFSEGVSKFIRFHGRGSAA